MALINGDAGNNTLTGTSGNDIINGNAGDDTLNAGLGADQVDGGTGTDTLVIDYSSLSVNVASYSGVYQAVDYSNRTYYSNIERFNLKSGSGSEILDCFASNDGLPMCGAGNDIITKGTGVDSIDGGAGIDVLVLADLTADTTGRVVT
ncbi:hypothetical protein H1Q63_36915, partial [Desmonostoc muscorum CCALA 125]|nr:hypothetical protein [Desmonostoc muscorum CCALA 125]